MFFNAQQKAFKNLLYLDAFRGEDGTGVFGVNKYGNVDMVKTDDPSGKFVYSPEYAEFEKGMFSKYNIVVGHNRKATVGAVNKDTAHPFISGNVVMVHNGKLHSHKKYYNTEVDSEALCKYLEAHENDLETAIPELDGYFSVVWYNAQTQKLRFWRNKDRPMFHAIVGEFLYFSSERSILMSALIRAGISPEEKGIYELKENAIHTLDMTAKKLEWDCVDVKVKEYPKSVVHYPAGGGYYGGYYNAYGTVDDNDGDDGWRDAVKKAEEKASTKTTTNTPAANEPPTKTEVKRITGYSNKPSDILELSKLIGKRIIFRLVDFTQSNTSPEENYVEGFFRDDVSVSCIGENKKFFEKIITWPHQVKFFRGTVVGVSSSGNGKTFDMDLAPDLELYEGFLSQNGSLISYDMIKDIGGAEYIFCGEDMCSSNIFPEDWEDTHFKMKYTNGVLDDHKIICKSCLQYKKDQAKKNRNALVIVGEKIH